MSVADQTCPHCGARVFRRAGDALEVIHEPDACPKRAGRQDAPRRAPGTREGPMRYGRPAGPEAPAVGMPPIPLAPARPDAIRG